ncbi:unnamed protein product [Ceutorhynchus assimilis]|uniref:F-box domain-containing protein n=1 Tax=Ceutorhynchus assimilis TaxID=467358 RepID=A0A9N9MK29_9CUCU|nr:unnamed protein product [Ceutorhynchus assimilis]
MDNLAECSRPKKSKSCSIEYRNNLKSQWAFLPSVVLHQVFDLLDAEDRKNASSVCRHWRESLFHPKWWQSIKFKIEHDNTPKAKFYTTTFGRTATEATIALYCLSSHCIHEFILLLRQLHKNNHLTRLVIEPSHCRFDVSDEKDINEIVDLILGILPRLSAFSLGGLEDLAQYTDCILGTLTPLKVKLLGLASIKDDISNYEEKHFKLDLISFYKNLQILSIDYDQLSDKFLYRLEEAKNLQRLVVHLHAIPKNHPGTTNLAWKEFKTSHPQCMLRLTVIHANSAIQDLHVEVLRNEMPLSHFKVFFCESVNIDVLHELSTFYARTLRSVVWIDSLSKYPHSWAIKVSESPDPFVLMSWLCTQFQELILYGYKYPEENLVAIGRLKGTKMKNLQISSSDIVSCRVSSATKDIANNLKSAWNPVPSEDLHPVILDPNYGDSDEFLLPFVLADLQ